MKAPKKDPEDVAAEKWRAAMRGRWLGSGMFRNFCENCNVPLIVHDERLRTKTDIWCEGCAYPLRSNELSNAFSPDRKYSLPNCRRYDS